MTGGVVECGYHGSLYSIEDGSVVHGPAKHGLDPVRVAVCDGGVWLS